MRSIWKRAGAVLAAATALAVLPAPVGLAQASADETDPAHVSASRSTVASLLAAYGLSDLNAQLRQARGVGDTAKLDRLQQRARAADGYQNLMKAVGDLPTGARVTLSTRVERLLKEAEAGNASSDKTEAYVRSVRLSTGNRLIDVVDPALLYGRSREVTRTELGRQPEMELCALAGCTDPLPPGPLCSTFWRYYAKNSRDFDWYGFTFEYHHLWGRTEARRWCDSNPKIDVAVNVQRVQVRVYQYEYLIYSHCYPKRSLTGTAYNTYAVEKSWNRIMNPFGGPSSSKWDVRGTGTQHWVDFDNWHHRSRGAVDARYKGEDCLALAVPPLNS